VLNAAGICRWREVDVTDVITVGSVCRRKPADINGRKSVESLPTIMAT